jgi:prepilin-type N-terminal cleavage/methylation domain-containing protein
VRRDRAGFTLIELMIAVTLVGALCAGVFACVRLALDTMQRVDVKLMHERRVAGVERIMKAELEGMVPTSLDCSAGGDKPGTKIPFFEGQPETMRLVSTYSLNEASRGVPRILELQVIPGENGAGVRLIVNELLYTAGLMPGLCLGVVNDPQTGAAIPQFAPVAVGPMSFVLADKLSFCHFEYHKTLVNPAQPAPEWLPVWIGNMLPDAVRIDLAPLHAEAPELELQPLTVPLHITREPLGAYVQ